MMCVYRARSRDVACAYTFFENSSRFRFFCDPLSDSLHFSLSLSLSLCFYTRAKALINYRDTDRQTDRQRSPIPNGFSPFSSSFSVPAAVATSKPTASSAESVAASSGAVGANERAFQRFRYRYQLLFAV